MSIAFFWTRLTLLCFLASFLVSYSLAQEAKPKPKEDDGNTASIEPISPEKFSEQCTELARKSRELELDELADLTLSWIPVERDDQQLLFWPSTSKLMFDPKKEPLKAKWEQRWRSLRRQVAEYYYNQAKQLVESDPAKAYRLFVRTIREDPDHRGARQAVGSMVIGIESVPKGKLSLTDLPQVGWKARTFHRFQTNHFRVSTNADAKIAQKWIEGMERVHLLVSQIAPELWLAKQSLKNRLDGKSVSLERRAEMNVILFRSRDDYLKQLQMQEANIGLSIGYYNPGNKTSFFYVEDNVAPGATLAHEMMHQFLQEASQLRSDRNWDSESDFWAVEAIALYAESTWIGPHYATVGGWESPRLQTARYRGLREKVWFDWNSFRDANGKAWRGGEDLRQRYTQAAGLAHFWMAPDQPTRRAAWLKYLESVYAGKADGKILQAAVPDGKLRDEYFEFLRPDQLEKRPVVDARKLSDCVLIGLDYPKNRIEFLEKQTELQWLDLAFVPVTSDDLAFLPRLKSLQRLNLEGTKIDQRAGKALSELGELQELDLSGTSIDDSTVAAIKGLGQLETLWLTGTKVTDECLEVLESMKQLKFVQADDTSIKKESWEKFLASRPDINQ